MTVHLSSIVRRRSAVAAATAVVLAVTACGTGGSGGSGSDTGGAAAWRLGIRFRRWRNGFRRRGSPGRPDR